MSEWAPAPAPLDELDRLRRLRRLGVGPGQVHAVLDAITAIAARDLGAPIALVSLVDADEQWFLARTGLELSGTSRAESFCGHALVARAPLVVPDARVDRRFAGNPLVQGSLGLRAYLGVPLFAGPAQSGVGTLCVLDRRPRDWSVEDWEHLGRLAVIVEGYIDGLTHRRAWEDSPLALLMLGEDGRCLRVNPAFGRMLGRPLSLIQEFPLSNFVLPGDRSVLAAMVGQALAARTSPTRRELRFVRLNGEVIIGGVSMAPVGELDGQVIVVIRDVSLERRTAARSGVVAAVHAELAEPLAAARARLQGAQERGATAADLDAVDRLIAHFSGVLDARIGDIASRVRVEAELSASEQRVRTLMEQVLGPLVVIDDRGRIVDVNGGALEALGWRYDELIGAGLRVIDPAFTEAECARWFARAEAESGGAVEEAGTFVRRDGGELRVELRLMSMDWNGPQRLVIIARDVTAAFSRESNLRAERDDLVVQRRTDREAIGELQRMEAALKQSLEEKETMLKEIHHRVKNNLQVVSSLLTLQMDQVDDPHTRDLLADSVRRVRSMALIHQHLYGSASLERVELGDYTRSLAEALRVTLAPHARLQVEVSSADLPVDKAVPICLILNELLTNAFKYGAPAAPAVARAPTSGDWDVRVVLEASPRELVLRVQDRGPGLPDDFRIEGHTSLGLQLVTSLARQVRGRVSAHADHGAIFELRASL